MLHQTVFYQLDFSNCSQDVIFIAIVDVQFLCNFHSDMQCYSDYLKIKKRKKYLHYDHRQRKEE